MSTLRTVSLVVVGIALAGGGYWYGLKRSTLPAGADANASVNPSAKAGGGRGTGSGGAGGGAPVAVKSQLVGTAQLPEVISTVGSLRSDESVMLRPEVAGRITSIRFKEGERVTKGATLVTLDASTNQAELAQARTNLELAKSKYDRAVDLASRNFISGQARDEAKTNYDLSRSALALVEARLAKTELKAPFSGVIGLRQVSEGDYVKEGSDLVNLEAIDPVKVDFRVPETFLREVQVGQNLEVALDALPGKVFPGKVLAVNPLLDAAGRSIVVRAQVSNRDTTLRPGMFARVTLITRAKREALVVPEEALVPQGADNFLFRVVEGRAERVKVQIGQRRDSKVEIINGVGKGDMIVTAGQTKLREGTPVRMGNEDERPANKAATAEVRRRPET